MPIKPGSSRAAVSQNIRTERDAGRPESQAVAIAMHEADRQGADAKDDEQSYSDDDALAHLGAEPPRAADQVIGQAELSDKDDAEVSEVDGDEPRTKEALPADAAKAPPAQIVDGAEPKAAEAYGGEQVLHNVDQAPPAQPPIAIHTVPDVIRLF